MNDMQTSLSLLIVRPCILNPVINFSTHLCPVKWKCPIGYTFALRIPFHLLQVSMQHMHQHDHQMIWSTPYHHVTLLVHRSWPHLLFTIALVHWRQVLLKLHRLAVHHFKASDLPFTLATGLSSQASSWSSPPWSHDSMSCLICNELLHQHMCEPCNITKPFSPSWHMLLTHMYLWTNSCVSEHKHILVHLKLLLNYQNQTGTFQRVMLAH